MQRKRALPKPCWLAHGQGRTDHGRMGRQRPLGRAGRLRRAAPAWCPMPKAVAWPRAAWLASQALCRARLAWLKTQPARGGLAARQFNGAPASILPRANPARVASAAAAPPVFKGSGQGIGPSFRPPARRSSAQDGRLHAGGFRAPRAPAGQALSRQPWAPCGRRPLAYLPPPAQAASPPLCPLAAPSTKHAPHAPRPMPHAPCATPHASRLTLLGRPGCALCLAACRAASARPLPCLKP